MDLKLEVVPIPVSDVDAAKAFYTEKVGFDLDHDVRPNEGMRVVQMTPPGSACSVVIGEGLPLGDPGSLKGVQLVVDDLDAVRDVDGLRRRRQRRATARARGLSWLPVLLLRGPRRQRLGGSGAEALLSAAVAMRDERSSP